MDVGRREDQLLDEIAVLHHRRRRALDIVCDPTLAPELRDFASAVELALTT